MLESCQPLVDAAALIADGDRPDWHALESTLTTEAERAVLRRLRAIAEIRSAHAARSFVDSLTDSVGIQPSASAAPGATRDLGAGDRWGPLEVLEVIGRGRFGTVYRAWDRSLDRAVALKLLRGRNWAAGSEDAVVTEEGRLMARVRHPNVVTIHGAQRIDGRTGLWMELVEGTTLEAQLHERGSFDAAEVVAVGLELCRALQAVHTAGLVHRDVKTQNVLREKSTGRVVLGDFGTGRELDEIDETTPMAGTPAYIAPEIFAGKSATPLSDLYSLGALLFHLATGSFPVLGRSLGEVRAAHSRARPESIRMLRPDLPRRLASAIDRALDPDPGCRFGSASLMGQALGAAFPSAEPRRYAALQMFTVAGIFAAALIAGGSLWRTRVAPAAGDPGGRSARVAGALAVPEGGRTFRQLSADSELAGPGGPSPDGRFLSYVNGQTGDLAIHEIATGLRRNVTANTGRWSPGYAETSRFSGDGSRLIYVWYPNVPAAAGQQPSGPAVMSIAVEGGAPRVLWTAVPNSSLQLQDWAGADDEMLVAVESAIGDVQFVVLSSSGRVLQRVGAGHTPHFGASLSIDGLSIVYDKPDLATGRPDIYLASVDGSSELPLIHESSSDYAPMWTRDGRYVLFLSDRSGAIGLWAQRVKDRRAIGEPIRLEPSLGIAWPMMGMTATGALFMRRSIGTRDVLVASIDPSTGAPVGDAKKMSTVGAAMTGSPDWSPDGHRVAYFSQRSVKSALTIKSLDDGSERELFDPSLDGVARPKWAPDGRSVYFKALRNGRPGLHLIDLDNGRISTIIDEQIGRYEVYADSGDILYQPDEYQSKSIPGRWRFVRRDPQSGREVLVHQVESGWTASRRVALTPAGDRLAYRATRSGTEARVNVLRIVDLIRPAVHDWPLPTTSDTEAVAWTRDGSGVIAERVSGCCGEVVVVDAMTGEARSTGLKINGLMDISFSPDGSHVAFDSGYPVQEPWVLEGALKGLNVQR